MGDEGDVIVRPSLKLGAASDLDGPGNDRAHHRRICRHRRISDGDKYRFVRRITLARVVYGDSCHDTVGDAVEIATFDAVIITGFIDQDYCIIGGIKRAGHCYRWQVVRIVSLASLDIFKTEEISVPIHVGGKACRVIRWVIWVRNGNCRGDHCSGSGVKIRAFLASDDGIV